ncbi:uncharacterized protein LTR77_001063 [Saxophila tyrrhenica]|uniref:Zn(2)-C6 fungal-type domain-containing protein n=1 Tax=Saxophila tyrrhenica TaxID=1690608 RepID=A0AAV9PKE7_9PEZI|nr:hypothetical protein LTR77_001063 [Saxophila tyrrhenica]
MPRGVHPPIPQMDFASASQQAGPRPRKRARTAVACRRCKARKQKCDGGHPACHNCFTSDSPCEYNLTPALSRNQEQYLRARKRVEELEGILGRLGEAYDHGAANSVSPEPAEATAAATAPTSAASATPDEGMQDSSVADGVQNPRMARDSSSQPSFVDVLRHLSLQATGGYVDAASTATFGRMLQAVVAPKGEDAARGCLLEQNLSPKSLDVLAHPTGPNRITLSGIPDVVANRMLEKGYFGYISTLWPIMQPDVLRNLHERRASLEDRFEVTALHLVYAAAGRFLETTGETGSFRSEQHYQAAAALIPEILTLQDVRSVQILALFAIYSLRAPKGPGAWSFVGMAMRMCIELGLHRKLKDTSCAVSKDKELRRRVFWSCYCLDRQVSIILGRPFAVSDHDVDQLLPAGVHEDDDSGESMACFVHICRLRIIESHIQQTVYRVDQPLYSNSAVLGLSNFVEQLEQWKMGIPSTSDQAPSSPSINHHDSYLIYYYQAVRFLLHPHISSPCAQDQYIRRAVDACGGLCSTYKRLHQNVTVGFSLMALHSVFFAGLTMLYCAWKSPSLVLTNSTRNNINDCSIVLYIITERWPGAKRYRDLFESIKDPVLHTIEQHDNQPQMAVEELRPDLFGALRSMYPAESGQDEFSAMLREMTGSGGAGGTATSPQTQQQQQYDSYFSTNDLSVQPGLAFDFSLPLDPNTLTPYQSYPSFNAPMQQWLPGTDTNADPWNVESRLSHSI